MKKLIFFAVSTITLVLLLSFGVNVAAAAPVYTPNSVQTWAVILSGGYLNEPSPGIGPRPQDCFENQIAETYRTLQTRGYDADNIFYLDLIYPRDVTGDGQNDVDLVASEDNMEYAITNWLAGSSDSNDICFIYLVNHGGDGGYFGVDSNGDGDLNTSDPEESIRDYEIAGWIDQVDFGELIFVIEACFSGDFIDNLSGANRIIVTSCNCSEYAWSEIVEDEHGNLYFNPYPAFSHPFFQRLKVKDSLGEAFNSTFESSFYIRIGGQHPLLDDNGDEIGHGPIPSEGDGGFAYSMCWMPGDCDGDDSIDIFDIVIVSSAYGSSCDPDWDPRADCNKDWVVDYSDRQIVLNAYGSTPKSPNWDPRADCNGDGRVNIYDLIIVNSAYGTSCDSNWDARADLDGNWAIDDGDLQIVQTNYGYPD